VRIVAGLGNPDREYEGSRHNAGFLVIEQLARECGTKLKAGRGDYLIAPARLAGNTVSLVMPLTYMNRSGRAIIQLLSTVDAVPSEILVVCDDVYLALGQLRLRRGGGDGGHNGLASIISELGTNAFPRLRLGVDAPTDGIDRANYVLERFTEEELPAVTDMIGTAAGAVRDVVREGIEKAMNTYNRRLEPTGSSDLEEA
jgi:PTH1 family peptidyl-tRNA hydrolase